MAEFPALPLFTDAYLADTIHLTAAQHGAYLMLLMAAWRSKDCALPNDDEFLSRIARMDKRTWAANREVVLAFWTLGADGKLRQARLADERNFAELKRNRQSQAGKASALKRLNRGSTTAQPLSNQNSTPTPTPTNVRDTGVSLTARSTRADPPPKPPITRVSETAQAGELFEPRGVAALKASAVDRHARAGRWEEFRAAYPRREGSQSWPPAQKKYQAIVASGVAEAEIIAGAKSYALHLQQTGQIGTKYVKQALTWLNQRGWSDEYLTTGRSGQSDLMAAFDARLGEARARADDFAPDEGGGEGPGFADDPLPPF